jgi:hypothetical protein
MILGREVRGEQPHTPQVDLARGEHLQDHRRAAGRAGDLDAVVGLGLGEAERVATASSRARSARHRRGRREFKEYRSAFVFDGTTS